MKVNIRNFNSGPIERKIDVAIDPWDTYGLDHSAALIILPLLLQLRQTMHGVPNEFTAAVGSSIDKNYCFDFIKEDEDEVLDQGCMKWEETMDKMIWSFQQIVDDSYNDKYHHGELMIGWKPTSITNPSTGNKQEVYEMVDRSPGQHWYDYIGHSLHEDRIQEGLDLFAKHFRNLWD